MVLTPKLIQLGVGPPFHPYFKSIIEWYDISPAQLSPNSWKLSIALFMLYQDHNHREPTMTDLSFFFRLGASSIGYYFLVVWKTHNQKGWSEGKTSNTKRWKEPFFYLWPDERVRTQFNASPSKSFILGASCSSGLVPSPFVLILSPFSLFLLCLSLIHI